MEGEISDMKTLIYISITIGFIGLLILFRILLRKIDKLYYNDGKCIKCGKPLIHIGENDYKEHHFQCRNCGFGATTPYYFFEEK